MKKTTQSNRVVFTTLLYIYLPYLIVNHFPHENRKSLPFILGEEKIPFIPWTVVIYLSLFLQAIVFIKYIPKPLFKRVRRLGAIMLALHLTTFVFYPVQYPRVNYESDNIMLEVFRFLDESTNCFPSLHVSCAVFFAGCYMLWETSVFRKVVMCLWSVLIILSVFTVKQHYALDVIAGIVLTISLILFNKQRLRY